MDDITARIYAAQTKKPASCRKVGLDPHASLGLTSLGEYLQRTGTTPAAFKALFIDQEAPSADLERLAYDEGVCSSADEVRVNIADMKEPNDPPIAAAKRGPNIRLAGERVSILASRLEITHSVFHHRYLDPDRDLVACDVVDLVQKSALPPAPLLRDLLLARDRD